MHCAHVIVKRYNNNSSISSFEQLILLDKSLSSVLMSVSTQLSAQFTFKEKEIRSALEGKSNINRRQRKDQN